MNWASTLLAQREKINEWLVAELAVKPTPFYTSVDVRQGAHKIAPVDTNIFPAGFNNIRGESRQLCTQEMTRYLKENAPQAKKLCIFTENFTRNYFYAENIASLQDMLRGGGYEVEAFREGEEDAGKILEADVVILNNDLTAGCPAMLQDIAQHKPVFPDPRYGWHNRTKVGHAAAYEHIVAKFCEEFALDPWLLSALYSQKSGVNFHDKVGLDTLALEVEALLQKIQAKYEDYEITEKPYVVVKAARGTFGMGVMMVESAEEILAVNKKRRSSMQFIKGGVLNAELILQEGVHTKLQHDGGSAELIVYMVGGRAVGAIERWHPSKGAMDNLNCPGMHLEHCPSFDTAGIEAIIAQLSALAGGQEHNF